MSSMWMPPALVLAVGLVVAWWLGRRIRSARRATPKQQASDDLRLRLDDLEAQRDDIYARLGHADEEGLDAKARAELERAAAITLRDLDRAKAQSGKRPRKESVRATEPASGRRSAFVGFASGVFATALIGLLVFWAVRDAKPDPRRMDASEQAQAEQEPHGDGELPPFVAAQVTQLEAALEANPEDTDARKQLALTFLQVEQYVPAFQHASEVLQRIPGDPDALFIHGVVRLAMGQNAEAIGLLDQVLGTFPQHVYAHLYKGLAQAREGNRGDAIETWRTGIRLNGGEQPEIQRLLDMAEASQAGGTAPATAPPPPPAQAAAGSSSLLWKVPDGWTTEQPSSPMRRAQYRVSGTAGDAELVVFYFGPGQGGDAMSNAERWAGQLTQPDGRPSTDAMTTKRVVVNDLAVLQVEVAGTYTGGMGSGGEMPDALLLGAVAEGPDANWFFKLTGPRATVEAERAAFDSLIASLHVGS